MVKRICFVGLLIVSGVFAQVAMALPYSTFGSDNGWAGQKTYQGNGFDVTLKFNVYYAPLHQYTWSGGVSMPTGDNYIYVYQIVNNDASTKKVGYLTVLDIQNNPISQSVMHSTTAQANYTDTTQGVKTDPVVSTKQGAWVWSSVVGLVEPTESSWFLIFSSDKAPTKGSFTVDVKAPSEDTEPPIPKVPEPSTIALLSIASGLFAARRKRKHQTV